MIISIASGKGGTGKTTVAVNLALSIDSVVQFLDCDVEEPNAHIFLKPDITEKIPAYIPIPEVDKEKCNYCGKCRDVCAYNAVAVIPPNGDKKGSVLIFPHLCHGCGGCSLFCQQKAIKEINKEIGIIKIGNVGGMQFVHGKLNIGEVMSPSLIRQAKEYTNSVRTVIIDAPPGTSCPVIAAVKGSDFCILVTEPTPFGLNDLVLAVEVLKKLNISFGVVINRADLGNDLTEKYCQKENIPILMKIPFKKEIAMAYSKGEPIVKIFPEYLVKFRAMFTDVCKLIRCGGEQHI